VNPNTEARDRLVKQSVAAVITLVVVVGCVLIMNQGDKMSGRSTDHRTAQQQFNDGVASMQAAEDVEYPPLTTADYSTTIDCAGTDQAGWPTAHGTLTSTMTHDLIFEVWVMFDGPDGKGVLNNAFTDGKVPAGGTGTFETFTAQFRQITGCHVVCVDQQNPMHHNERENCQQWADLRHSS